MSKRISALFFILVFLIGCSTSPPHKGEEELVTTPPVKETVSAGGENPLEQIQTALDINCAVGNILACIIGAPGAGVSIFKELGRIFKGEDTFEDIEILFRQAAIIEATKDSCVNVMGDKNRANLFVDAVGVGKGFRVECVRVFDPKNKDVFRMEMTYYRDATFENKIQRSYSLSGEKDKAIAKSKCLQAIDNPDLSEIEYKDTITGANYKFTCTKHFVGEDKFSFLRIGIIKNNVRNPMMVFYPVLTKEANKP